MMHNAHTPPASSTDTTAPAAPAPQHQRSQRLSARLLRAAGDLLARRAAANGRLCIINYHRILEAADPLLESDPDVATFRWQMQVLADCFNVLSLPAAMAALAAGTLPPRAVCITFDDGYRSTHDLALPVLQQFGLPATVFVATGFVSEGSNMWNDRILEAVRNLRAPHLDLSAFGLGSFDIDSVAARVAAIPRLTEQAKYLAPAARQALIEHLDALADIGTHALMVTDDMIRALAAHNIEIGAHTISHPILTKLSDDAAMYEMAESKRELETILGREVRYFAYPNGKEGMDFDHRHVAMAREAGFAAAFTTAIGAASRHDDLYALPRSRPWDATPAMFALRLLRWLA